MAKVGCPGLYCAYWPSNQSEICTGCPWGYRADLYSQCIKCTDTPTFYDWLYLGFMAIIPFLLHCCFLLKHKVIGVILAFLESSVAAISTLLLIEPTGKLVIQSCTVNTLSDWYTMLLNPSPNHVDTLHCTHEAVYPLYTIVLLYYLLCLVTMLLLRFIVSLTPLNYQSRRSVYAALYFMPILAVAHATCAGLVYYSFPYILLGVSVIANAIHLARFENQQTWSLIKFALLNKAHFIVTLVHWLLLVYGIIALTQLAQPRLQAPLLCLVPLPAIFYVLTVKFTDPDKLEIS